MHKYYLALCFIITCGTMMAQKTISGIVTEAGSGLPVIGASIQALKENSTGNLVPTGNGTASDIDGLFTLDLATDEWMISVSYIGYVTQSFPVGNQTQFKIELVEDNAMLEELVVVGYGTQRKVDVTGATASVKGEDLLRQPVLTATQALQGKVAGVQVISSGEPGSSPIVRVRGVSSAIAGTATLYVVDGVLTDDISNINTNDIVSMDILKDASSTAIYGARGANGVITITTKKGASGALRVNYNNNIGIKNATNLVEMANSEAYANYLSAATGTATELTGYSTDWYDQILRQSWFQNHNLSLSGGTEKATYYISGGFLSDEGIVIENKFKRFNIRSNLDFELSKMFKTGIMASFSNTNNKPANLGTAYNNAYRAAPIIQAKENGLYGNTSVYQNVGNPILDIEHNKALNIGNRIQASGYLEFTPVSWITFRSSIGGDLDNNNSRSFNARFENDETTFLAPGGNQRNPNSNLSINFGNNLWWVWDNTVRFEKVLDAHRFTFLVGTTAEQYSAQYVSAFRKDVPDDPNLWYISTGDANTSTNSGGGDKWARNAYLSRLNYSLNDKYLFTGTLRYDGSSRLSAQNRWGLFPSVGAGWVISNEEFMQQQRLFDHLKFRTSWGRVGNDRVPSDAFVVTLEPDRVYPFGGGIALAGSAISQIKDPNLKWETTDELDFGLEFGMLNNRLTGEIGFYNKKANDLLINVKVPSVVGDADGQVLTNAASIRNTGLEFALSWRNRSSDMFSYAVGANATFNKNEVIGLNGGQPILDGGIGAAQQYTTKTDNGYEVGAFYVLDVLGVFQNDEEVLAHTSTSGKVLQPTASAGDFKYRDLNDDGVIDDDDRIFAGSYQPKLYFGVNGSVSYGRFDLSADIFGNLGNKVYNGKKAFRQLVNDNIEKQTALDRWYTGSGINDEPRANSGNLPASTYFVESGDYIRLNNVTLSYNLAPEVLNRLKIAGLRVYLTSQNLYTWKKYSGFTAELPGGPTQSGIEKNAYPTSRTIAAGINVTF